MFNQTFFEGHDIHQVVHQGDANTDITSLWMPVTDYDRVYLLLVKGGTEDVDDLGLEVQQATDNAAAGAKSLTVSRVWVKSGAIATVGQWTHTELTTPATGLAFGASVPTGFTRVAADVNTGAFAMAVEIMASSLDIANGFTHVAGFIEGDNVDNACLVSMFAIFCGARYSNEIPLTVIK